MTKPGDRIPVPTNGHRTDVATDDLAAPPAPGSGSPASSATPGPAPTVAPERPDITLAVTPGQLAVGFGILASIVLLVLGRRRGRSQDR